MIKVSIKTTSLSLTPGDITLQCTEAIVNAANSSLMGGGGVDGAIHRAGGPSILEECKKIVAQQGNLPTGKAVITSGGNLSAHYVIHTVGPIWRGGNFHESELLASCYNESLKLAESRRLKSMAFPSISTGAYGYPIIDAAKIAVTTVVTFLENETRSLQDVIFVLFDSITFTAYETALKEIRPKG